MKRAGVWLTWSGAAIMLISIVAIVALLIGGIRAAGGGEDNVRVSGPENSARVYFEAGDEALLWVTGPAGVSVRDKPTCAIDGPADVQPGTNVRSSVTTRNMTRESFASLRFVETGWYTFTCDRSGVEVGPPVDIASSALQFFGVFAAILTGGAGLIMTIVGIVLWVIGARRAEQHPAVANYPTSPPHPGLPPYPTP